MWLVGGNERGWEMVLSKGWWKQKQDCSGLKGEGVNKLGKSLFKKATVKWRKPELGAQPRTGETLSLPPSLLSFLG